MPQFLPITVRAQIANAIPTTHRATPIERTSVLEKSPCTEYNFRYPTAGSRKLYFGPGSLAPGLA